MSRFIDTGWLLSVVVAGIAINIISAYVKQYLDRGNHRAAGWWEARSLKRRARFEEEVRRLIGDDQAQLMDMFKGQKMRLTELYCAGGAAFLVLYSGLLVTNATSTNSVKLISWVFGSMIFLDLIFAFACSAAASRYERRAMEAFYRSGTNATTAAAQQPSE